MRKGSLVRAESGYVMIALLVAMSVMAVLLTVALPVWTSAARREKEAELVFRGEQYARAIMLFQRKYGNALPPNVDVLVKEKFLRKQYKDPITRDDFLLLGPGSAQLENALPAGANGRQSGAGRGTGRSSQGGLSSFGGRSGGSTISQQSAAQGGAFQSGGVRTGSQQGTAGTVGGGAVGPGGVPGGIMGVTSKSKETSMRLYNGRDKYNEWIFVPVQTSTRAGAGAPGGAAGQGRSGRGGVGPQGPGGRGGFGPRGFGSPGGPGSQGPGRGMTLPPFGGGRGNQ